MNTETIVPAGLRLAIFIREDSAIGVESLTFSESLGRYLDWRYAIVDDEQAMLIRLREPESVILTAEEINHISEYLPKVGMGFRGYWAEVLSFISLYYGHGARDELIREFNDLCVEAELPPIGNV